MCCVNKVHHSLGILVRLAQSCQFHPPLLPYRKALLHANQSTDQPLCSSTSLHVHSSCSSIWNSHICPLLTLILPNIQFQGQKSISVGSLKSPASPYFSFLPWTPAIHTLKTTCLAFIRYCLALWSVFPRKPLQCRQTPDHTTVWGINDRVELFILSWNVMLNICTIQLIGSFHLSLTMKF